MNIEGIDLWNIYNDDHIVRHSNFSTTYKDGGFEMIGNGISDAFDLDFGVP